MSWDKKIKGMTNRNDMEIEDLQNFYNKISKFPKSEEKIKIIYDSYIINESEKYKELRLVEYEKNKEDWPDNYNGRVLDLFELKVLIEGKKKEREIKKLKKIYEKFKPGKATEENINNVYNYYVKKKELTIDDLVKQIRSKHEKKGGGKTKKRKRRKKKTKKRKRRKKYGRRKTTKRK
jgi:hypothetical protein